MELQPNKSFKPNLLRNGKSVAGKACHAFASTTQVGLTQALGLMRSSVEHQAFKEALAAAARGPFFPDWEFETLIGFERPSVDAAATSFSPTVPLSGDLALMLNNCLVNLLGYPHGQDAAWAEWLSVTPQELEVIFSQWRASGTEA